MEIGDGGGITPITHLVLMIKRNILKEMNFNLLF